MENFVENLSDLDANKRYSYADYLTWKFYQRTELHDGKLIVLDNTGTWHQTVFGKSMFILHDYFKPKNLILIQAPFDVRILNESKHIPDSEVFTVVQPDFSVFDDDEKLDENGGIDAPILVIEILSPLSNNYQNELFDKFNIYEKAGVKEYWVIAPQQKLIMIFTLKKGCFVGLEPIKEDGIIQSVLFPDLKIKASELLIDLDFL